MFPIRDTIRSRNYPVMNISLIAVNVLLYLVEMAKGPELNRFIFLYGLVPARYSIPEIGSYFTFGQQVLSFISFMFLHGGFWHLLGNMWTLYIFGDNIEDRLGHLRYLLFYLLCGWASGLSHLFLNWHSQIPTIGASGAIAGVMGAYFILFPTSRILTLIPIFFIPYFIEIPAFFFLGIWFLIQFLSAAASQEQMTGIAFWAHVGGFVFGLIAIKFFQIIPDLGLTERLRHTTEKRKSPRLQVIQTTSPIDDPNLYAQITITPQEAYYGAMKLVNIPWGFHKRLFRVKVSPGVKDGTNLRLVGMGKRLADGRRGDLYLKVVIGS